MDIDPCTAALLLRGSDRKGAEELGDALASAAEGSTLQQTHCVHTVFVRGNPGNRGAEVLTGTPNRPCRGAAQQQSASPSAFCEL